jgi:hypothetical protein
VVQDKKSPELLGLRIRLRIKAGVHPGELAFSADVGVVVVHYAVGTQAE